MELISPRLRNLWNDWDLRLMVLLCLALQTVLILLGHRRKYNHRLWIRIVTWCAYLSADSLATVALGILSSKLGDVNEKSGKLDERSRLIAFWAPCLLLLLGGQDNITAYALEDNELWLRHLLGVAVQTGVTAYIYFMAWSVSYLSLLSFVMIIAGVTKYGERTWVLWLASSEKRKETLLASQYPSLNYPPRFIEECHLKRAEGYDVTIDDIVEFQFRADRSTKVHSSIEGATELIKAYSLIPTLKRLFANLILSNQDKYATQAVFEGISSDRAFKIIEIELGFMYDILYSKATVLYSKWGFSRRLITFSITCTVLASFSIAERAHHRKVDLAVTYLLLVVVVLLEIYSIALLISSDWTNVWLHTADRNPFVSAVTSLQLCKHPRTRWSNSVGQFSFLSFCLKQRPFACSRVLKLINVHEKVKKYRYTLHEEIPKELKDFIFSRVIAKYGRLEGGQVGDLSSISYSLGGYGTEKVNWSTEGPLDQIIITWHVATELCYYSDCKMDIGENSNVPHIRFGRLLARYMLYLLVMYPFVLPKGIGQIRFRDTKDEAIKFLEDHQYVENENQASKDDLNPLQAATYKLLEAADVFPPSKVIGGMSKSVLFDGCIVASTLNETFGEQPDMKWKMISKVWTEMLLYAAFHCEGDHHAHQLRRGGELITHVWLLLAHFGLTDHFQTTQGHVIAKLILR